MQFRSNLPYPKQSYNSKLQTTMKPQPLVSSIDQDTQFPMPIKSLNTFSRDWKIQARVVDMSEKRQTKNQGSLIKLELMDSFGTRIEATLFNDAADYWGDKISKGKVYDFYDGSVKIANRRFTNVVNDFSLVLERTSKIVEIADCGSIQKQ